MPALFTRLSLALLPLVALALPAPSALAQSGDLEPRVKKLEAEMRAVQRKVFPGGTGRFFEPEITQPDAAPKPDGITASSPVADLLQRVDALELRLATLTSQTEENNYKLGQMEERLAALETRAAERDKVEAAAAPPVAPVAAETAAAAPTAERIAAVSAIVKPETGDAGEDEYIYGYRLWEAKFYPEAQQQLQKTVDKYPKHARISHARNLLGRAYLDDGKPSSAAKIFLDNYQTDPRGERAPDSLYFLGEALIQVDRKKDACSVFLELAEVYPDVASGRLANRVAAGRRSAGCA